MVYANHNTRECKVPFNAAIRAIFNDDKYNAEEDEEIYDNNLGGQEEIEGAVGGDNRS